MGFPHATFVDYDDSISNRIDAAFLNEIGAAVESHTSSIASLVAGQATLFGRVNSIDASIVTLQGRMTAAEGDISDLDIRVTALENRVTALEAQMTALTNAFNNFVSTIATTIAGNLPANIAYLDAVQAWTAGQGGTPVTVTPVSIEYTPDFSLGNNFAFTLTQTSTLKTPTNVVVGQGGIIVITQDYPTPWFLTFDSFWKFPYLANEAMSTTAGATDVISYYVYANDAAVCFMLNKVS